MQAGIGEQHQAEAVRHFAQADETRVGLALDARLLGLRRECERQSLIASRECAERFALVVMDEMVVELVQARFAFDPVVVAGNVFAEFELLRAHSLQKQVAIAPVPEQPVLVAIADANFAPICRRHLRRIRQDPRDGAVEIVSARLLVGIGNAIGKARAPRADVVLGKIPAAQQHAIGIAVDGEIVNWKSKMRDKARHVAMCVEKTHAAQFGDEMRCLRKRDREEAPADALAGLEKPHAQVRPFKRQPPRRVRAGRTAADDRHIEIARPGGTRGNGSERDGGHCAEESAPGKAHGGRIVAAGRKPSKTGFPGQSSGAFSFRSSAPIFRAEKRER